MEKLFHLKSLLYHLANKKLAKEIKKLKFDYYKMEIILLENILNLGNIEIK